MNRVDDLIYSMNHHYRRIVVPHIWICCLYVRHIVAYEQNVHARPYITQYTKTICHRDHLIDMHVYTVLQVPLAVRLLLG
jgi:hypothetical protein